MQINSELHGVILASNHRTLYLEYLLREELPLGKDEARRLARRVKAFVLLGEEKEMYRWANPLAVHPRQLGTGIVRRNPLGGLWAPHDTLDPRWQRLQARVLLANSSRGNH
jgi:hypothetical protein